MKIYRTWRLQGGFRNPGGGTEMRPNDLDVTSRRSQEDPKSPCLLSSSFLSGWVVRLPSPEPLPAIACSCDWGAALVLGTTYGSSSLAAVSAGPHVIRPVNSRKQWVGGGDDGDVEHNRTADLSTARDPCDPGRDPA